MPDQAIPAAGESIIIQGNSVIKTRTIIEKVVNLDEFISSVRNAQTGPEVALALPPTTLVYQKRSDAVIYIIFRPAEMHTRFFATDNDAHSLYIPPRLYIFRWNVSDGGVPSIYVYYLNIKSGSPILMRPPLPNYNSGSSQFCLGEAKGEYSRIKDHNALIRTFFHHEKCGAFAHNNDLLPRIGEDTTISLDILAKKYNVKWDSSNNKGFMLVKLMSIAEAALELINSTEKRGLTDALSSHVRLSSEEWNCMINDIKDLMMYEDETISVKATTKKKGGE